VQRCERQQAGRPGPGSISAMLNIGPAATPGRLSNLTSAQQGRSSDSELGRNYHKDEQQECTRGSQIPNAADRFLPSPPTPGDNEATSKANL